MKSVILIAFVLLNTLIATTVATSSTGSRVLVLLDDLENQSSYSRFWKSLQDRKYQLDFKKASDPTVTLHVFGESSYNHIIHFAPRTNELAQHTGLNNVALINFVKQGGNLLVAVDEQASSTVRDLANEFDIEFDPKGTRVLDKDAQDKHDNIVVTEQIIAPTPIIDTSIISSGLLYRGIGLLPGKLPLLNRILTSEKNAVSGEVYNEKDHNKVDLIAAMQTRQSSRVTFSGSLDFFSDEFWTGDVKGFESAKLQGNEGFIKELTKWTFQEKGVLKVVDHRHHKENSTEQLEWYRIKDNIVYVLEVAEYKDDHWVPFHSDDIQLEVIMLDPYIRTTLKDETPATTQHHYGRFISHLTLPDVYGVFTFKVNYKRPGWTYLLAEDVVAIRPFRHNEYPRFLVAAYPYYTSVGSMIIGFLVFSTVWLATWGSRSSSSSDIKKKSQ
ncbi:Dolichyl-diphosphooligosaccharide--protein glycosyltransferase subunit WBP1 [Halteromyces radiatus]|uniref:Dolichyl-diphosphooligosaccharide--protein glycosyltransferase subunit WBP1 n=1 Tax=Halteromyces radiatus TaxID=101107 RepID=UPI0022203051|nr:Dolichyl-diphosphooligosaccharide--protein glycosyltransferase subunit WBP1 [Halteromyces radiatus]KAI8076366.1 Dolichyl-diphosphooligosaccharide--protein glycosyltransferase subunit WBP1 [Halteromyces radiatus]